MSQITAGMVKFKVDYHTPKPKVRLRDRATGAYLHLSGVGVTTGTRYAWSGTKAQARALRDRATAKGEDWPFKAVKRIEVTG